MIWDRIPETKYIFLTQLELRKYVVTKVNLGKKASVLIHKKWTWFLEDSLRKIAIRLVERDHMFYYIKKKHQLKTLNNAL